MTDYKNFYANFSVNAYKAYLKGHGGVNPNPNNHTHTVVKDGKEQVVVDPPSPSKSSAPKYAPDDPNIKNRLMIKVNAQGEMVVRGRAIDMMGMVYKVQEETGKLAQDRLSFTAKELFDTNKKTKMLVSFLNSIRGIRPTGKSTDTASADDMKTVIKKFMKNYGGDPFIKLGVSSFAPSLSLYVQDIASSDHSHYTLNYKVSDGKATLQNTGGFNILINQLSTRFFKKNFPVTLPLYGSKTRGGVYNFHAFNFKITKSYSSMEQAKIDQLIEAIKSKISNLSSNQQLLQEDVTRYTSLSDETNEAMTSIEKSVFNTDSTLDSKI